MREKGKLLPRAIDMFRCSDCKVDTLELREYYMLTQKAWAETGLRTGMLCIGCVEKRIGRKLRPRDFTGAPVNGLFPSSDRLVDRRGAGRTAFKAALKYLQAHGDDMPRPKGYAYVCEPVLVP